MPDLKDFSNDMRNLAKALAEKMPDIATGLTLTAKALSERNIKEKGFGENYSTNEVPAFFFEGKALNAAGEAFIETKKNSKNKEDRYTTWGEVRQAQGLQVAHVDFSYSNKTWAGMVPLAVEQSGYIWRAPLGANNIEVQNKMNYGRDMYGNFVERGLTEDSYRIMQTYVLDEVEEVITQNLL